MAKFLLHGPLSVVTPVTMETLQQTGDGEVEITSLDLSMDVAHFEAAYAAAYPHEKPDFVLVSQDAHFSTAVYRWLRKQRQDLKILAFRHHKDHTRSIPQGHNVAMLA